MRIWSVRNRSGRRFGRFVCLSLYVCVDEGRDEKMNAQRLIACPLNHHQNIMGIGLQLDAIHSRLWCSRRRAVRLGSSEACKGVNRWCSTYSVIGRLPSIRGETEVTEV